MSEKRPTEKALGNFSRVKQHSRMGHSEGVRDKTSKEGQYQSHMAISIYELGEGLENLTTGIRATYLLLEEVKRMLEQRR